MFTRRFFILLAVCIVLALCSYWWPTLLIVTKSLLALLSVCTVIDGCAVFAASRTLKAKRVYAAHISLDQANPVEVTLSSSMPGSLLRLFKVTAYDTVPHTFTTADDAPRIALGTTRYIITPKARGRYEFGVLRCFVTSRLLGLAEARRFLRPHSTANVYPTFRQLDKLEEQAAHNTVHGQKRLRRAGNSTDFDQIRSYVPGDDVRKINWRATARANSLMVNHYTDERSKPIIPVVCAGPSMLVATDGITLLDRAVSASVALASSAIKHYDEAGLITLTHKGVESYLKPERSDSTVSKILRLTYDFGLPPTDSEMPFVEDPDVLYEGIDDMTLQNLRSRMDSCSADADITTLGWWIRKFLKRRSLIVLFANFENLTTARNAINTLRDIGRKHTLVVVLFTNEGVEDMVRPKSDGAKWSNKLSELRFRALCADYIEQQEQLAHFLRQHHINVVLTHPDKLSTAVLKTYLDLKNQGIV